MYSNIGAFLKENVPHYWRDTWTKQPVYIMIWLEKQALQNTVWSIASQYNAPVFVGKGYSSWDLIIKAAEELREKAVQGKRLVILYLGDYDPSGEDMPRDLHKRLSQLGIDVELIKLALTPEQVELFNLPHMPVKDSDPRTKNSDCKYAVELDALEPSILRGLVQQSIESLLDLSAFEADQILETKERLMLQEKVKEIVDKLEED